MLLAFFGITQKGLTESLLAEYLASALLKDVTEKLQAISQLVPLQIYLRQAEVSDLLDSLLEACWKYAIACDDVRVIFTPFSR